MMQPLSNCNNEDLQKSQTGSGLQQMGAQTEPSRPIDAILKDIFCLEMVILSFVSDNLFPGKTKSMLLSGLSLYPAEQIDKYLDTIYNNLTFVLPWQERKYKYSFLVLGFKTENDLDMSLKLMEYTSALQMHCLDDNKLFDGHIYPNIIPVVIYTGCNAWTSQENIGVMYSPIQKEVLEKDCAPHTSYILIDVRNKKIRAKGKESAVINTDSLAFQILALTSCQNFDELEKAFPIVQAAVKSMPNAEKLDALLVEATYCLLKSFGLDNIPVCKTLEEMGILIAENAPKWRNSLIQQGKEEREA